MSIVRPTGEKKLQLVEVPDGEILGLLPGQHMIGMPDGKVTIINSNQTDMINQPGVSILASCVAPGVITDASGTATASKTILVRSSVSEIAQELDNLPAQSCNFSVGDFVKMIPEYAAQIAQSPQFTGVDDAIRRV